MTVDREKIRQKIQFMRDKLRELERLQGMSREDFATEPIYQEAAIRMLQVTIEAMLDICSHVLAREGWELPRSYGEVISRAAQYGLIPIEMENTYRKMVRFRNRVVHLYDDVDAAAIQDIIQNRLEDFTPFLSRVVEKYFADKH